MDRSRINKHVWGSLSKRGAEFVALTAEVTTLKGNLKLAEKIAKKQKPSGGGGGPASKARAADKCESQKEMAARLALWQSECIALKKIPPTTGGPSIITFMKKEDPWFGTKSKPFHWCKHHLMWCMHTSDQCKVGSKQATEQKNHKKPFQRQQHEGT